MDTQNANTSRLYFFWDYDISEEDVRRILRDGTPLEKAWVITRILEYAKWDDIWRYLTLSDIGENLEHLQFRQVRETYLHLLMASPCIPDCPGRRFPRVPI